jgi:hypothetical protein
MESKMHINTDIHKSYEDLSVAMDESGVQSMKLVLGIDFSSSNIFGELHGTDYKNPYMRVIEALMPIAEKYD